MDRATGNLRHAPALDNVELELSLHGILKFPRERRCATQDILDAAQVELGGFGSFVEHDQYWGRDLQMGDAVSLDDAEKVLEDELLHDVYREAQFGRHETGVQLPWLTSVIFLAVYLVFLRRSYHMHGREGEIQPTSPRVALLEQ